MRNRVKSLAEINETDRPEDRVRDLGTSLEHLLKKITPNGHRLKPFDLVKKHESKFKKVGIYLTPVEVRGDGL